MPLTNHMIKVSPASVRANHVAKNFHGDVHYDVGAKIFLTDCGSFPITEGTTVPNMVNPRSFFYNEFERYLYDRPSARLSVDFFSFEQKKRFWGGNVELLKPGASEKKKKLPLGYMP